jgi:hypothetical protein
MMNTKHTALLYGPLLLGAGLLGWQMAHVLGALLLMVIVVEIFTLLTTDQPLRYHIQQ